ncbi:histidine kinase [Stenotrophomonas chelatiphaga]|jgi:DNA-binding response OmpR family regulator|uniref:histidine kinase n=1 Tax=Stenotrophomonas chelatiphaga TaxID=517011 RepID=A0A0R0DIP7_9GAMM|nr:response regulator [Stenotrophomonas chelatiphaga]KRG77459.1 histidine kinase [Stenotrophomonas chelatiphaga]MCS4229517.1 DNA-binding response OmpR family regulator [Stenotrophomonas chelatiphaga]ROQ46034.1 phospho-acceptor domain-containing protein [Stenotrophomonas maltophilia]
MPHRDRILIVDDNVATRYAVRRVLEHHGYRVDEAGLGQDGLDAVAGNEFAALVLDVNLPDMSGFDVVRELRSQPRTALLPVVHVSAASISTGDMITGLDAGADGYLTHPVDPEVLLATLRSLLRARRAEDALREAEARFGEIFRQINAPIAVLNADLTVRDANAAFARLLGTGLSDGSPLDRLGNAGEFIDGLRDALRLRERWQGTVALPTPGGTPRMTQWRLTPYQQPDLGLVVVEDITAHHERDREQRRELAYQISERERTEAELLQAQKMDALGQLTGGIAHDFNNLLTTIISGLDMIELAADSGKLDRLGRYIDAASSSATRAAALTQRMLAFARKQPLDPQPFDVAQRVHSLEDLLRRTIGENIELEFELGDEPLVALADPNQFESVVLNLVINARDALGGNGLIRIRGERTTVEGDYSLAAGDYISVKVMDNGSGIEAHLLKKVFEPFFTTKPQGEGTGLGLSMTYGFARQSGGVARISSEPGAGTEVELLLPLGDAAKIEVAGERGETPVGRFERILVVDDTDSVRQMVQDMLREAGYEVIAVADARQALRELRDDEGIALLLSDVGLPGMNGRELADAARELRPRLPVLFITGYTERAAVRNEFLGPGMGLLPKPFNLSELLRAVSFALR